MWTWTTSHIIWNEYKYVMNPVGMPTTAYKYNDIFILWHIWTREMVYSFSINFTQPHGLECVTLQNGDPSLMLICLVLCGSGMFSSFSYGQPFWRHSRRLWLYGWPNREQWNVDDGAWWDDRPHPHIGHRQTLSLLKENQSRMMTGGWQWPA